MGVSESGTDAWDQAVFWEKPEHDAFVDPFYMDTFEVTVGRFRKYVDQFDGTLPSDGDGALAANPASGWDSGRFDGTMPKSETELRQLLAAPDGTWADQPGGGELAPINNVQWNVAFAFCIWDGGRLPTEAEWEFASAGGEENRLYPWGSDAPDATRANYIDTANSPLVAVGSSPAGKARWGHMDLAGNVEEFTRDIFFQFWYSGDGNPCNNCARTEYDATYGGLAWRGGSWMGSATELRSASRGHGSPLSLFYTHFIGTGFRCVRSVL